MKPEIQVVLAEKDERIRELAEAIHEARGILENGLFATRVRDALSALSVELSELDP